MKKHVKFEENNFSRGTMHQISPKNHPLKDRSFGAYANGFGDDIRENATRPKRFPPPHVKDPVVGSIQIPTTLAEAPFLEQSRLTPGQKRYLCTIAAVHNDEYVKKLLQQHYMNIAHRCIRTGGDSLADLSIKAGQSLEPSANVAEVREAEIEKRPEIPNKSGGKHPNKKKNGLPKINNSHKRVAANTVKSKKGATKKSRTAGEQKKISTPNARPSVSKPNVQRDDDEDSEDSLDELLRALSMEEDDDIYL